eukprot:scaffold37553_cov63-Phaeocystis_antarctica.AAC.3
MVATTCRTHAPQRRRRGALALRRLERIRQAARAQPDGGGGRGAAGGVRVGGRRGGGARASVEARRAWPRHQQAKVGPVASTVMVRGGVRSRRESFLEV